MSIKSFTIGPLATNCYLYVDDKTNQSFVVDPAIETEKLIEEVSKVDLKFILLTHAHIDHIMAVHKIKELTGAKIVANINEANRLCDPVSNLFDAFSCYSQEFVPEKIDIAVIDGEIIDFSNNHILAISTPGHTDGSMCFVINDVIFSGDTLFCRSYGRTDLPTGNFSNMIDSFYKLTCLEGNYKVLPGHQNSTTLDDERENNPLARFV